MIEMVNSGEVDALVAERVWQETVGALREKQVLSFFNVLQTSGALERIFPEINRIFGTRLCLQEAVQLTSDTQVRFAVLIHNLDHESIETLCQRYCVPSQYHDLAIMVARYHSDCHRVAELSPEALLNLFQRLDAFRRPQRFEQFLLACEAIYDLSYPEQCRHAFKIAQKVDVTTVLADGFQGAAIGKELQQRRVQALGWVTPLLTLHD